jgi:tetratricopeptide (TPR) repeat protein
MRRILIPVAVLLLAAVAALGDRKSAEFFSGRGDKALQGKDFAGAEEQFRRALQEDPAFVPARFGHAQALLGLARPAGAVTDLMKVVADVKADAAAPPDWKALAARAEKQLQELDASDAEFQKILDRHADDLVALARKWAGKDPAISERAARRALEVRPGDTAAEEILAKVDALPKGAPIQLFNGVDLKNWDRVEFPFWQVREGFIFGEVREGSKQLRTLEEFTGDYEVRMEARLVEERVGQDAMLQLLAGYRGEYDYVAIGLINRKVYFVDRTGDREKRILAAKTPIAEWKAPFDPTQFAVYTLRFHGEEVAAFVNGEAVGTDKRAERRMGGFIGIYAQGATVAFRKVEVQKQ